MAASSAAAYVVLRPHLGWARRAARQVVTLQPWSLPSVAPTNPVELARALIGAAVLAPSGWNSQPWRFEVETTGLRLVADSARSLPMGDPDQREMLASLGAALENLLVAGRAWGLRFTVDDFPYGATNAVTAAVSWTPGETRRDLAMFAAIPARRTNRREYDGRALLGPTRAQLAAQMPDQVRLHWIDGRDAIRAVSDAAYEAVEARTMDRRIQAERRGWMRFGDSSRRRGDGVSLEALDLNGPARWFASRYFNPNSRFHGLGAGSAAKQARETIRSSGALALLSVAQAGPAAWLAAGQAYERLALKATQLDVAHHPLSDPVRHDATRGELLRRFGASGEEPLVLVRFGRAKRVPASPRRAVALVSSFRTS